MPDADFPQPVSEVMATLAEIFRHQGRVEILGLLENAHARFDEIGYDNWNGGTTTWGLRLEVPLRMFAVLHPGLAAIEKEILSKLDYLKPLYSNDFIGAVNVTPIPAGASVLGQRMIPSELDASRLWPGGRFRLFLSHVAKHKVAISKLKEELRVRGVAAFLAHEDIEPSLEWRTEIELGLRSMHAMAALITSDFHASNWTDQEIGWTLGRGVLVLPVRLESNPYGFFAIFQAVSGSLDQPKELAIKIVDAILTNPQSHGEMRRSLANCFASANSDAMAQALARILIRIADLTGDEKSLLQRTCVENDQVANAIGVPEAIYKAHGKPPEPKTTEVEDEVPF